MQFINFIFLLINYFLISDCAENFATINDKIPNIDVRIVGGETVLQNEIPWQISLQVFALLNDVTCFLYKNQWTHYCGGSIITNNMVVTAGHCIDQMDPRIFSVIAGTINRRSTTVPRHFVNRTILHEGYNSQTVTNDIGLVKIQDSFEFSASVSPIRYDCSIAVIPNTVCLTSGWGYYLTRDQTGTCLGINTLLSNNLQKIYLTVTAPQICGASFNLTIPDSQICTAGETLQGPCGGDSGGPLIIADTTEGNCLVGLTSYGGQSCIQGLPAAFTRVSSYIEWINANI